MEFDPILCTISLLVFTISLVTRSQISAGEAKRVSNAKLNERLLSLTEERPKNLLALFPGRELSHSSGLQSLLSSIL
ncbi:ORF956 [White spot syndrome virus]|uniref:ORF956 n=1 Tax=White spot syndrome virus TaxID=342409 RepID=A0A2D3I6A4_9VIRU|nr:ORF956 [White spot syndrome virus]